MFRPVSCSQNDISESLMEMSKLTPQIPEGLLLMSSDEQLESTMELIRPFLESVDSSDISAAPLLPKSAYYGVGVPSAFDTEHSPLALLALSAIPRPRVLMDIQGNDPPAKPSVNEYLASLFPDFDFRQDFIPQFVDSTLGCAIESAVESTCITSEGTMATSVEASPEQSIPDKEKGAKSQIPTPRDIADSSDKKRKLSASLIDGTPSKAIQSLSNPIQQHTPGSPSPHSPRVSSSRRASGKKRKVYTELSSSPVAHVDASHHYMIPDMHADLVTTSAPVSALTTPTNKSKSSLSHIQVPQSAGHDIDSLVDQCARFVLDLLDEADVFVGGTEGLGLNFESTPSLLELPTVDPMTSEVGSAHHIQPPQPNNTRPRAYFSESGRISLSTLKTLSSYLLRIVPSGRFKDLAIQVEFANWLRVLQLLEDLVRDGEVTMPWSSGSLLTAKKSDALDMESSGFSGDGNSSGVVTVTRDEIKPLFEKIGLGLQAILSCFLIMVGASLASSSSTVAVNTATESAPTNHSRAFKKLVSEEILTTCITSLKSTLKDTLLSSINILNAQKPATDPTVVLLVHCKKDLTYLSARIQQLLKYLDPLLRQEKMNESLMISIIYTLLDPFTTEATTIPQNQGGGFGIDKICVAAIDVLTGICTKFDDLRSLIIDEVVAGFWKGGFGAKKTTRGYRLANGQSIHVMTALIMNLVQASSGSYDSFRMCVRDMRDVLNRDGRTGTEEIKVFELFASTAKSVTETTRSIAFRVLSYILSRCFPASSKDLNSPSKDKRKSHHSDVESEYRAGMDVLKDDLLVLLDCPEWPAAEMVLRLLVQIMLSYVEETKKSELPAKTYAIDVLGDISARLKKRTGFSNADPLLSKWTRKLPSSLDIVSSCCATSGCEDAAIESSQLLWGGIKSICEWLNSAKVEDKALESSKVVYLAQWIALAFPAIDSTLLLPDAAPASTVSTDDIVKQMTLAEKVRAYVRALAQQICEVLEDADMRFIYVELHDPLPLVAPGNPLDTIQGARPPVSELVQVLATRYLGLESLLSIILVTILQNLESPIVALRTKSLRSLQQIIIQDPETLSDPRVQRAIGTRFHDSSPSVRDAVVELVGKYIGTNSNIARTYFQMIAESVSDSGTAVRKRSLKLLRDIYQTLDPEKDIIMMGDLCSKFLSRFTDEEDSVKDLAMKFILELWLTPFKAVSVDVTSVLSSSEQTDTTLNLIALIYDHLNNQNSNFSFLSTTNQKEIRQRLMIIRETCKTQNSLSEIIPAVLEYPKSTSSKVGLLVSLYYLTECAVDYVVSWKEVDSGPTAAAAGTIDRLEGLERLLEVFNILLQMSKVVPVFLSKHLPSIYPFLNRPNESPTRVSRDKAPDTLTFDERFEEKRRKISYSVMDIFRNVVPVLPQHNMEFMTEVQVFLFRQLQTSGPYAIKYILGAACAIVRHVTGLWQLLCKVLAGSIGHLRKMKQYNETMFADSNIRAVCKTRLLTVAYLMLYADFDKARIELKDTSVLSVLDQVTKGPLLPHLYELALSFAKMDSLELSTRHVAVQALGIFWLIQPKLMVETDSRTVIGSLFQHSDSEILLKLLVSFYDLLKREQERMKLENDKKKSEEKLESLQILVGTHEDLGDASVSSSVMQLYLERILGCLFVNNSKVVMAAFDVISLTLEQGLVHPILAVPSVVAMETCPMEALQNRAQRLHDQLSHKHASFIHTRNTESIRKSFDYQVLLAARSPHPVTVTGIAASRTGRPEALLSRFYQIVREKRANRNQFLAAMVKTFELLEVPEAQLDIHYYRYVVENLACFDYRTQEEVLHVIYWINAVLASVADNCSSFWDKFASGTEQLFELKWTLLHAAKLSLAMSMLLILRSYLRVEYGISEARIISFKPTVLAKHGEKALVKVPAADQPIKWDRLLFARSAVFATEEDMMLQGREFQTLLDEDGGLMEEFDTALFAATAGILEGQDDGNPSSAINTPTVLSPQKPVFSRMSTAGTKKRASAAPVTKKRKSTTSAPSAPKPKKKKKAKKRITDLGVSTDDDEEDDDFGG